MKRIGRISTYRATIQIVVEYLGMGKGRRWQRAKCCTLGKVGIFNDAVITRTASVVDWCSASLNEPSLCIEAVMGRMPVKLTATHGLRVKEDTSNISTFYVPLTEVM